MGQELINIAKKSKRGYTVKGTTNSKFGDVRIPLAKEAKAYYPFTIVICASFMGAKRDSIFGVGIGQTFDGFYLPEAVEEPVRSGFRAKEGTSFENEVLVLQGVASRDTQEVFFYFNEKATKSRLYVHWLCVYEGRVNPPLRYIPDALSSNVSAMVVHRNYKAEAMGDDGYLYTIKIHDPNANLPIYENVLLARDGITIDRRATDEGFYGLTESQASLRLISESDRYFYGLYCTSTEEPITMEIYRSRKGKSELYWAGTLIADHFFEPYSYNNTYITEVRFSDFAVLSDKRHFENINNVGDIIKGYTAEAFKHNKHRPALKGLDDEEAKTYPFLTPTLSSFFFRISTYAGSEATMYSVLQDVLKSFSLRLEQRNGAIYLYDLFSLPARGVQRLKEKGTNAQLETLPAHDVAELNLGSVEKIDLLFPLADELDERVAKGVKIKRTNVLNLGQDGYLWRVSPRGSMGNFRIEPKGEGEYQYGVALVMDSTRGGDPEGVNKLAPNVNAELFPDGIDTKLKGADVIMSPWDFFIRLKRADGRLARGETVYNAVTDFIAPSDFGRYDLKLSYSLLASNSYNIVDPTFPLFNKLYAEGFFKKQTDADNLFMSFYKGRATRYYQRADITLETLDGKPKLYLTNFNGKFVNQIPRKIKYSPSMYHVGGEWNKDFWNALSTGDMLAYAIADNFLSSCSTEIETTVKHDKQYQLLKAKAKNVGAILDTPRWVPYEFAGEELITMIPLGSYEDINPAEWLSPRAMKKTARGEDFIIPLGGIGGVTEPLRLRIKIYPRLIASFRHKKEENTYTFEPTLNEIEQKVTYDKRYILQKDLSVTLIHTEKNANARLRAWGKSKENKATRIDLPLVTEDAQIPSMVKGLTCTRDNALMGYCFGKDGRAKLFGSSAVRFSDVIMPMYLERKNKIMGTYFPLHDLKAVMPPDYLKYANSFAITDETVNVLDNSSSLTMIELPTKDIERKKV